MYFHHYKNVRYRIITRIEIVYNYIYTIINNIFNKFIRIIRCVSSIFIIYKK